MQKIFPVLAKRVLIFVGAYGSGKTEVALNYAVHLAGLSRGRVSIIDLDIVNPYFRSREAAEELEREGVRVIVPEGEMRHADLPIIVPQIRGEIERSEGQVILDVGGDAVGARVLSSLADSFRPGGYEFLLVLNCCRPFTCDEEGSLKVMQAIETSSRLKFTGIISNTHLMGETTADIVEEGYKLAVRVGAAAGVPVVFVSAEEKTSSELSGAIGAPVFRLSRRLLKPWEGRKALRADYKLTGGLGICRE